MRVNDEKYLAEIDRIAASIYCNHDSMGLNKLGESRIRQHRHRKAQLLYTEGGVTHVTTPDKNYFLPARHFMWIPAGAIHSITASSAQVMMRNLYFPVQRKEAGFYKQLAIYPVSDMLLEMLLFTNRWNGHITREQDSAFTYMQAIKKILPEACSSSLSFALPYPKTERLLQLVRYLYAHMDEEQHFPEVAKRFGYSERTLARVFREELDMTFVQYFTLQRMMKALQFLLDEKRPVNETAYMVGYNSVPTFSNTFYKIVGERPSDYVKLKGVIKKA
ncbi:AraC family transcriptional regulator [Deminuibacter soli]|uniref:AraC family transcriptional regulator n=1 Tax=Deminuibacter soli TaxID=2291815 RepID=A0A3E1NL59_9BACT|nr:AraC family transcriptional regulator [Deminuibacter soli]RFM28652.1 AraC family transcriptional regulator [Deminuibacter soli]